MTDESKVKTTFIRPVNRTMSYEDRRGYVYVCVCKQKQNGRREMHKCFLYRVIWTITSNYPNNYYSSMFNKIHAIHNIPCL